MQILRKMAHVSSLSSGKIGSKNCLARYPTIHPYVNQNAVTLFQNDQNSLIIGIPDFTFMRGF